MTTLTFKDLLVECDSQIPAKNGNHKNTPGNFHASLQMKYDLGCLQDYEVCLCDITYPITWFNVSKDTKFQWGFDENHSFEATLYAGLYVDLDELVDSINNAINESIRLRSNMEPPQFLINNLTRRVEWTPRLLTGVNSKPFVKLPELLSRLTGYYSDDDVRPNDISNDLHSLHVHLHVVRPQIIGSSLSQVIQVLHIPTKLKFGRVEKVSFSPRKYIPLDIKEFDTLKIMIKDVRGDIIDFKFGSVKLWLHFRQSKKHG